jgi:hypothetical protein
VKRQAQFVVGSAAGGLIAVSWLATEWILPWEARLQLLWFPFVLLVGLVALGALRKQFAAALGYLLGLSPAIAVHLLVVVVFGALWGWESLYAFSERLQRRPFEATVWREHPDDRTRARMSDDLIQSRKLVGLTVSEAQALLGPPSSNLGGSACDLAYWLGTDRGWLCLSGTQGRILTIRFREYDD